MNGPSRHLSWSELANWNRFGRKWGRYAPGELVAAYPPENRQVTVLALAATFEDIRVAAGNLPLIVNSAYRTPEYNRAVGGAKKSQHVQGRALDIRHGKLSADELYTLIRQMLRAERLPLLGGVGAYRDFVHIDVRPRESGRVAFWSGTLEGDQS